MPELLLELFSEEIPARMQSQAARDLERMARERLAEAGLSPQSLRTYAGPRRLALVAEGLPAAQEDRVEERKGPRANAPEQALEGFLRSTGLRRDQLVERDGVLYAEIARKGRPTPEIVAEMVDGVVRNFPWPKSMRWGYGTLRWVRPLQRIVCVFDGKVVPFQIDGIQSGALTEGHRFMGSKRSFKVEKFAYYEDDLRQNYVVLDAAERKEKILNAAHALCFGRGLELVEDDGLLEEVTGLAEWPTPILGDMDPAFLDLPPEVIRTSMRVHQKYFAVRYASLTGPPAVAVMVSSGVEIREGEEGFPAELRGDLAIRRKNADEGRTGLAPHFITVANIEAIDGGQAVAEGNSRVLSARLNDARFFWDEDGKVPLEARLERLKGVTFHAKLGTMAERVERITALAREIAPLVGADPELAATAARLAKADLATGMVGEFPELQGIMGGYYARQEPYRGVHVRLGADGTEDPLSSTEQLAIAEDVEGAWYQGLSREQVDLVADAIRDHYRPLGPGDTVPLAPVSVAVALADKLDSLVGFFGVDEKPTGSKDPYALRRAALGVIRIVLESEARISLRGILRRARFLVWASVGNAKFGDLVAEMKRHRELVGDTRDLQIDASALAKFGIGVSQDDLEALLSSTTKDLLAFFADRLKVTLRDQGKRHDLVDAVFALGDDDLVRIVARVQALDGFLKTDDGANLLAGYRRAVNILKAEQKKNPGESYEGMFDLGLASVPEESALAAAVSRARDALSAQVEAEDFAAAMTTLAGLRAPVDAFFDKVLVNDADPKVRLNRLRLLSQMRDAAGKVADFSLVAG